MVIKKILPCFSLVDPFAWYIIVPLGLGPRPWTLRAHHSFMVPIPSCDVLYHYIMSTMKTTWALSCAFFFSWCILWHMIHIVFSWGYDHFNWMDLSFTFLRSWSITWICSVLYWQPCFVFISSMGIPTSGMIYICW